MLSVLMETCGGNVLVGMGCSTVHHTSPTKADEVWMRVSALLSSEAGPTSAPSSMYQNCAVDERTCRDWMMGWIVRKARDQAGLLAVHLVMIEVCAD